MPLDNSFEIQVLQLCEILCVKKLTIYSDIIICLLRIESFPEQAE